MAEDTQSQKEKSSDGPLAGQRLARARRERDITVLDIAKELHLDEYKVRALENNEFEILGAPVFAKGHLRKYAELVGVNIDDVLADYYALNRGAGAPPVVGPPRKPQRELRLGPWVAAIVVISAAAAIAYWWLGRARPTAAPSAGRGPETRGDAPPPAPTAADTVVAAPAEAPPLVEQTTEDDEATTDAVDAAGPDDADADVDADAGADDEVIAEAAPVDRTDADAARPQAIGAPEVNLVMAFSGDCWTEVTDASGSRLFFDLGRDGRRVTVSGEAPLRVLFGNSNNVTLTVDGNDFVIPDSARRGQTARLTINAQ